MKEPKSKKSKPWADRTPLESFDPRYKNIWLKAALSGFTITLPNEKAATAFLLRLQMYRKRYQETYGKAEAAPLYRAKASREGNILSLAPSDAAFAGVLSQFPSGNEHHTSDPLSESPVRGDENKTPEIGETEERMNSSEISIDELFANLKQETL